MSTYLLIIFRSRKVAEHFNNLFCNLLQCYVMLPHLVNKIVWWYHHFNIAMMNSTKAVCLLILSVVFLPIQSCCALSSSSSFHGMQMINPTKYSHASTYTKPRRPSSNNLLVMRKQKASDKRTARMQRGVIDNACETTFTPPSLSSSSSSTTQILDSSPMTKSKWKQKKVELRAAGEGSSGNGNSNNMGRGRARKRLKLYNSLASYHFTFLEMIQEEYQMEVCLHNIFLQFIFMFLH